MVFWQIWSIFFLVPPRTLYPISTVYVRGSVNLPAASSLAVLNRPLSSVAVLPVLTDEDQRRIRRGSFDMLICSMQQRPQQSAIICLPLLAPLKNIALIHGSGVIT